MDNARTMDLLQGCKMELLEREAQITALAAKAEAYDLFKDLIGLIKPASGGYGDAGPNIHYHIARMMEDLRAEDKMAANKADKEDPEEEFSNLSDEARALAMRNIRDNVLKELDNRPQSDKENLGLREAIMSGPLWHVRDGVLNEVSPSTDDDRLYRILDHIRTRMDLSPALILTEDGFDEWLAEREARS